MRSISRRNFLQIGAAGLAGVTFARAQSAGDGGFTFAVVNDTHIVDAPSVAILDEAVARINSDRDIQFTCVLGDVATDGKKEELLLAKSALEKLERPYYVVPGNHDVFMSDADIYANYAEVFGPVHWRFEFNGWSLIGFNSCEESKSEVTVSDEELAWLKAQADAIAPERPIALFCHHPLNPNSKAYRILNADAVLALFAAHTLQIAAAGHWHGNQMEEQDGVLFITTACCSSTRPNFDNTPEKGYRRLDAGVETTQTDFTVVRS